MGLSDFCRVCADLSDKTSPLFRGSLQKLLPKIKDLTGLELRNTKDWPQNICKSCEKQIQLAHKFRECCIRAQKRFETLCEQNDTATRSKRKPVQSPKIKDEEVPPIEEVIFNESNEFKVEENDEDSVDVLLKQEPTNIADDSSSDHFNFLAEEFQNCGDDTLAIEPEISLVTEEPPPPPPPSSTPPPPSATPPPPAPSKKYNKKEKTKSQKIVKTSEKKRRPRGVQEKNYICDQCGKHFTNTGYFNMHMLRHSGNRSFQCKLCPKAYFRSVDLDNHMMKHTGEKPYPCKYCERRFNDKSHLVRHTRGEHTNERPFACNQCPKTFISSNNLKHHLVTHSGVRAYKCKLCNMSYKRTTHLSGHYRSVQHKQNLEKQQTLDNAVAGTASEECNRII